MPTPTNGEGDIKVNEEAEQHEANLLYYYCFYIKSV